MSSASLRAWFHQAVARSLCSAVKSLLPVGALVMPLGKKSATWRCRASSGILRQVGRLLLAPVRATSSSSLLSLSLSLPLSLDALLSLRFLLVLLSLPSPLAPAEEGPSPRSPSVLLDDARALTLFAAPRLMPLFLRFLDARAWPPSSSLLRGSSLGKKVLRRCQLFA